MTFIDILIIIGVILYIILGFRDGFFKKVFGILGFWFGLIAATKFMPDFGKLIEEWLSVSKETSLILSFFIIFFVISVGLNLFYRWFGKSGSDTLKMWSRLLGGILGAVQGLVVISLVLIMFNIFHEPSEEEKQDSILYHTVYKVVPVIFDYSTTWLPESKAFLKEIEENFGNLKFDQ